MESKVQYHIPKYTNWIFNDEKSTWISTSEITA